MWKELFPLKLFHEAQYMGHGVGLVLCDSHACVWVCMCVHYEMYILFPSVWAAAAASAVRFGWRYIPYAGSGVWRLNARCWGKWRVDVEVVAAAASHQVSPARQFHECAMVVPSGHSHNSPPSPPSSLLYPLSKPLVNPLNACRTEMAEKPFNWLTTGDAIRIGLRRTLWKFRDKTKLELLRDRY